MKIEAPVEEKNQIQRDILPNMHLVHELGHVFEINDITDIN